MRTGAPVRDDRGPQPRHPRLGELLSEGECPNPVPPTRRLDQATPALLHRPAMAEHGVAALSHVPSGERVRTGPADPSGAWDQEHSPSTATTTQESGLRENRTSRLSERTEEGRKPDLLRLYGRSCHRPKLAAPARPPFNESGEGLCAGRGWPAADAGPAAHADHSGLGRNCHL